MLLGSLVWCRGRRRSSRTQLDFDTVEQGYVLFDPKNSVSSSNPLFKDMKEEEQGIGMASVKGSTGVDRRPLSRIPHMTKVADAPSTTDKAGQFFSQKLGKIDT